MVGTYNGVRDVLRGPLCVRHGVQGREQVPSRSSVRAREQSPAKARAGDSRVEMKAKHRQLEKRDKRSNSRPETQSRGRPSQKAVWRASRVSCSSVSQVYRARQCSTQCRMRVDRGGPDSAEAGQLLANVGRESSSRAAS